MEREVNICESERFLYRFPESIEEMKKYQELTVEILWKEDPSRYCYKCEREGVALDFKDWQRIFDEKWTILVVDKTSRQVVSHMVLHPYKLSMSP